MENGIYTLREITIGLYEKDGATQFVTISNDGFANKPMLLSGEAAENLILAIANCLNVDEPNKGS